MEMTRNAASPYKFLRYLFYVHIAGIAISVIGADWGVWLSIGVTAAEIYCLSQLVPLGERYKQAVLFASIALGMTLVSSILKVGTLLTLAASILSIIAAWQEYNAHSELVGGLDTKLSRSWHGLFYWELGLSLVTALLAIVAAVILALGEVAAAAITGIVALVGVCVGVVLGILYLVYLNKTAKLFDV